MANVNIYTLADPISGEVKYVGKTIRPLKRRLSEHMYSTKRHNYKLTSWIKSLNSEPIIELVDEVEFENWQFWEKHYISLFKSFGFNLKNISEGGEIDNTGKKFSIESKLRMSQSRKNNPNYKKPKGPMSEEGKKIRKQSNLKTFKERFSITQEFIDKVYFKIDFEKKSLRKTALELNVPFHRVRSIYILKQYN